jgi:hypothetical protein
VTYAPSPPASPVTWNAVVIPRSVSSLDAAGAPPAPSVTAAKIGGSCVVSVQPVVVSAPAFGLTHSLTVLIVVTRSPSTDSRICSPRVVSSASVMNPDRSGGNGIAMR